LASLEFKKINTVGSDVIDMLGIYESYEDATDMISGDILFQSSNNRLYTYSGSAWINPLVPDNDKLYLSKQDTLTYKWNGIALVETTSPLPYATLEQTKIGSSFATLTSPFAVFGSFKWWMANTIFSSLNTVAKNIIGAINELRSEKNIIYINASLIAATYNIERNKQTGILGNLPAAVTSTFTIPTPISGERNESIVHITTGTTVPVLSYSGFTPKWLNNRALSPIASKAYTICFEQTEVSTGTWIVKTSYGEY